MNSKFFPASLGLFALGLLVLFLQPAQGAASQGSAENGKSVYETTCVACHGNNGKGTIPGAPDFTKKNGPLSKSDFELYINITEGFQSPGSAMAMPPNGGNPDLTAKEIKDVIAYLRAQFEKK
ncbi:MAG TPA: cytochrome c [Sphingomonadales bacterium]|nr:cytochrome c [Sphingomonadales bacterium]